MELTNIVEKIFSELNLSMIDYSTDRVEAIIREGLSGMECSRIPASLIKEIENESPWCHEMTLYDYGYSIDVSK